jgi:hypothetical protein
MVQRFGEFSSGDFEEISTAIDTLSLVVLESEGHLAVLQSD